AEALEGGRERRGLARRGRPAPLDDVDRERLVRFRRLGRGSRTPRRRARGRLGQRSRRLAPAGPDHRRRRSRVALRDAPVARRRKEEELMTMRRTALAVLLSSAALAARAQNAPKPPEAKDAKDAKPKAEAPAEEPEEIGAWIGNRFLQTSSPLVNDKGIFEANFNHRFYASIIESGGSRLYGLDNGAAVFLSMDYAPLKNVSVQISRASQDA